MREKKIKRMDNKGFTLVELLIAIAIIAIIVSPILDGIVTSMRVNKKSDALQKETAMANTVMEGMENMSLEDIAVKLSVNNSDIADMFPAGVCDNSSVLGEITTGSKCITEKNAGTKTVTKADGSTVEVPVYSYDFNKNTAGKYVFALNDMKYDGETYDVRVTLDASNTNHTSFNDALYVDIAGFDKKQDGIFSQETAIDKEICGQIAVDAAAMGMGVTADDVDARASRVITVKIYNTTETDIAGKDHTYTKADVTYRREVDQSYVGTGVDNYGERKYDQCYTNTADETKSLRNLYILINPLYTSKGGAITDKVVIDNEANVPVNVYLIKQNNGETDMLNAENFYRMDIHSICSTPDGSNPTTIRTNLGYNLADLLNNKETKVSGQCRLTLENEYSNMVTVHSGEDFYKKVETITSGSNEYVRVFDKKVEVFSSGACKSGAGGYTFEGSPLATIESKVDAVPPAPGP